MNKINTKQLQQVLETLSKTIGNNLITDFNSFIFDEKRIITYNDRWSLEIPFDIGVKCSVPSIETLKIISGIKQEEISIKLKEDSLIIRASRINAQIMVKDFNQTVIDSISCDTKWKKIPSDFIKGLKLNIFSASKDISLGVLNNISIKDSIIESSDNMRISQYQMSEEMDSFMIPLSSAIQFSRMVPEKYQIKDNWLHILNKDKSIFHVRILDNEFPDCSQLFKVSGESFSIPSELQQIVELVSVLSEGEFVFDKKILVSIEDHKFRCKAENETGWIETDFDIDNDKKISFSINPVFLLDIISMVSSATISSDNILFESDNFKHIMSLFEE